MPWREHGMAEPGGTGVCGISLVNLSARDAKGDRLGSCR
jgi:hypothetical protein